MLQNHIPDKSNGPLSSVRIVSVHDKASSAELFSLLDRWAIERVVVVTAKNNIGANILDNYIYQSLTLSIHDDVCAFHASVFPVCRTMRQ